MKFIIIHGSFGHPGEHWIPLLADSLNKLGQSVLVPAFPCDDWDDVTKRGQDAEPIKQSLDTWIEAFMQATKDFVPDEQTCIIGHSLGPLFTLHIIERFGYTIDSAVFVSPFLGKLNKIWQADKVNGSFYREDFDFSKLRKSIPTSYVLYSDNDPYVETEASLMFTEKLHSSSIVVRGAGHINKDENYPLILELCKTRITKAIK